MKNIRRERENIMSPRRKRSELAPENALSEEIMYTISGGYEVSRLRAKCPVPGCNFECSRMTELNAHMRQCHPGK